MEIYSDSRLVVSQVEGSFKAKDPIIQFLAEDRLLSEIKEADRVHRVAVQFWLS